MKRNYLPLLVAVGAGIALGWFVTSSAIGLLLLVLLLACPLMMIVMMSSMGGMRHDPDPAKPDRHERPDDADHPQQRG